MAPAPRASPVRDDDRAGPRHAARCGETPHVSRGIRWSLSEVIERPAPRRGGAAENPDPGPGLLTLPDVRHRPTNARWVPLPHFHLERPSGSGPCVGRADGDG